MTTNNNTAAEIAIQRYFEHKALPISEFTEYVANVQQGQPYISERALLDVCAHYNITHIVRGWKCNKPVRSALMQLKENMMEYEEGILQWSGLMDIYDHSYTLIDVNGKAYMFSNPYCTYHIAHSELAKTLQKVLNRIAQSFKTNATLVTEVHEYGFYQSQATLGICITTQ